MKYINETKDEIFSAESHTESSKKLLSFMVHDSIEKQKYVDELNKIDMLKEILIKTAYTAYMYNGGET